MPMSRPKPPADLDLLKVLLVGGIVLSGLVVFLAIMWACLLLHPIVAVIVGGLILLCVFGGLLAWYLDSKY
jgi:hypothetical protein